MKRIFIAALVIITVASLATIAWAAWMRIILIDSSEQAIGTATNPIYIQNV